MKKNLKGLTAFLSALTLSAVTFSCDQPHQNKPGAANTPSQTTTPVQQSDFVGNWKVADGDNVTFYITLNSDGTAISTWGDGQSGTWKMAADKAHVTWSDGWVNVLYKAGSNFKKNAFAPGAKLDGIPTNSSAAEKVSSIPPSSQPKSTSPISPGSNSNTPQSPTANQPRSSGPASTGPTSNSTTPTSWRRS